MTKKRIYSRYHINRGNTALWNGDPTEPGSTFRQIIITSDDWNSTAAIFQVLSLQGTSKGLKDSGLAIDDNEVEVLFDEDRHGLKSATDKASELIKQAEHEGFSRLSIFELAEYEEKVRQSKK
ncbi:MAG TPA: hypothetical protein VK763_04835 [Terriglobales bacterium]|nr:hypothetical protein [Terriglobales bacterium]